MYGRTYRNRGGSGEGKISSREERNRNGEGILVQEKAFAWDP